MEHSNESLVRACRRGDETAWEVLVSRYQRLVYAVPRRAGLDAEASADVFQEVFVTLVRSLETLEQPERLSAWLLTIARRAAWRHVQQRIAARANLAELDEVAEEALDGELLPEDALLLLEEQHEVRTALAQLDERCRQLLTMLFYSPVSPSYQQAAAALGMAEGSIGPIRARCLERLQRQIKRLPT